MPSKRLCAVKIPARYLPGNTNAVSKRRMRCIFRLQDCRVCLAKSYYPQVYYDRNKWMIEHSSLLICYQSSGRGGTAYTVNSAEKNGVPVNLALYRDKLTGAKRFLS